MKLEELILKWKDMYVVNKGREWMRKDFIKDLKELQSTEQEIEPMLWKIYWAKVLVNDYLPKNTIVLSRDVYGKKID